MALALVLLLWPLYSRLKERARKAAPAPRVSR